MTKRYLVVMDYEDNIGNRHTANDVMNWEGYEPIISIDDIREIESMYEKENYWRNVIITNLVYLGDVY